MAEYDETTYGERIAEVYDLFYGKRDNPETDSILCGDSEIWRLAGGAKIAANEKRRFSLPI